MANEDHRASSGGRAQLDRDTQHIAASIAQKLQEARLRCEIVNLLPVEAAVLRRDRIIVILARIRLRHVGCNDGRHDDAFGRPNGSHVCPYGPTN